MRKRYLSILLAVSLVLNVILGAALILTRTSAPDPTEPIPDTAATIPETAPPTTAPEDMETVPPTEDPAATETSAPAEGTTSTVPSTAPETEPDKEYIGSLYTRQELEAMENECKGYGPGTAKDGNRAPYADSAQAEYGQYGAAFIAPDNGCIYLTFDCGYEYFVKDQNGNDVALTGMILDTLKEEEVKAVFFVTLSYCQKNPELVQRMIDEGHTVGSHSASHPSMPSLTIDEMVEEIMTLHNYVLEHFGYTMTLFRPPMGEYSTRSLAVAQSLGYKSVFWSFAYADWDTANQPAQNTALAKIVSCHHSGAIYLLHAVSETNAAVLGEVIDELKAMGYTLALYQ